MIDLCAVGDVPDGGAIRVPLETEPPIPTGVVVVRDGDAVHVYENVCPHFRIPLDVGRGISVFRKHVLCANHYAAFRFSDGACVEGPCLGASLRSIPIEVSDGRVRAAIEPVVDG